MPYDGEIIDLGRLAAGDKHEWIRFVNQYHLFLVKRAIRIIHDIDLAEDIAQSIFLCLWIRRSKLVHIGSLSAYLTGAATNTAVTYLRERSKGKELPLRLDMAKLMPASEQSDPRIIAENEELGQLILQAIKTLTPRQQQIVNYILVDISISTRQMEKYI